MKISNDTIKILTNFSEINTGLLFKQGNTQKTISANMAILAEVTIPESFDRDFGIYNLGELLNALSLHSSPPEITLEENHLLISGDSGTTQYWYTDKKLLTTVPDKKIVLKSEDVKFNLPNVVLAKLLKAANLFQSPHIAVESDGKEISVVALDVKNQSAVPHTIKVADHKSEKFKIVFKKDNIKLLPLDYELTICFKNKDNYKEGAITRFVNQTNKTMYYLSTEKLEK